MTCLTPDKIELLVRNQLPSEEARQLGQHAAACPACRQQLEECRANEEFLGGLKRRNGFLIQRPRKTNIDATASVSLGEPGSLEIESADWSHLRRDAIPGYEVVRQLSGGGQGTVYEAVQIATRRTVAIKVLREGPLANERARWRFDREVKLVAAMKHPGIVVIHDSGVVGGMCYFVMDYVPGQPLDTHARLRQPTVKGLIRLMKQVCEAVAYAHRRGVIHRDLKPMNILVSEDGAPCVLDFGLAKILSGDVGESGSALASMPGVLMGTLRYMSPEQTQGAHDAIDMRTDVYSLGVILYELLTGSRPYDTDGDIRLAIGNIREVEPPRPSRRRRELNNELDAIILKAMDKDPQRRYGSAGELAEDLGAWLDGRPVAARSASSLYLLRKLAFKHYFHTSVVATVVLAIVGFAGISHYFLEQARAHLRDKTTSETALRHNLERMSEFNALAQDGLRRKAFGWFLLEWQAGRLDRARQIRQDLRPDFPEHVAMSYLLDEGMTEPQLRAALSSRRDDLLHFTLGEKLLKAGQVEEACRELELSVQSTQSESKEYRLAAAARLGQLRGTAPASSPSPARRGAPK
jgi:eukaryotic-like serine/threonine-protein kinase